MSQEQSRVSAYLATLDRMEPNLVMVDQDATLASIAISLKRLADRLDQICQEGPEVSLR